MHTEGYDGWVAAEKLSGNLSGELFSLCAYLFEGLCFFGERSWMVDTVFGQNKIYKNVTIL